jgi:putative hemolysin
MNMLWVEVLIILVLVLANGFFAASEIAVVSSRKGRLAQRAEEGQRGAATALDLAEDPSRFLSTVQVGITVISTFAAAFGGASLAGSLQQPLETLPLLQPYAATIALTSVVVLISYLSLILGELVPKRLALQSAESVASSVAPIMSRLAWLAGPVVSFLTLSTGLVMRLLGRHNVEETPVNEEDVLALVREGREEGTVEESEQRFISSVFAFTDRTVRSLMTPRTQVVAVEINTPLEEVRHKVLESGYSRIPVFEDALDVAIGILHAKDLLQTWDDKTVELRSLLRPPLYLPESQRAVVAFQQLKQQRSALAIVLDEYGQMAGVISMEDMLEELVGDIGDEYDDAQESIVRRDDGSYLVDGLMSFVDFQHQLRLPSAEGVGREGDFETVAGCLLSLLGRIPGTGDSIVWQGYTFEVVDMDGRRIDKILVRVPQSAAEQTRALLASRAASAPPRNEQHAQNRSSQSNGAPQKTK